MRTILLVASFIIFVIWAANDSANKWDAFASLHNCKLVATVQGEIFNTYGYDMRGNFSVGVGNTSSKKGYLCDDGVTYYR